MKKINLKDLCPEDAVINLEGKEYTLRKINLEDEAWLLNEFGDRLESVLKEVNMLEISKIVFRQLRNKSDFVAQSQTEIDQDGIEVTTTLGGYKLLLKKISGINEKLSIYKALLKTIGISRPILDQLDIDDQKKSPMKTQTGEQSLMPSQASTGTRSKKSKK